jgi:hypothetical protein
VFLGDRKIEVKKERDERVRGKSQWQTGTSENILCELIIHPWYDRYESRSSMKSHRYMVFPSSSGKSYPWFLISASNPPHHSHLHTSTLSFSSTTLLSSPNTQLSHPSLSPHVIIISWHQVQHTTVCSIHRVQHTPKIVCTLSSHDYKLTPECNFIPQHASLHDRLALASSSWQLKGNVNLSHSDCC